MKIAIVSDTHNNWPNFQKAIDWINKEDIQLILHCGDIQNQEIVNKAENEYYGIQYTEIIPLLISSIQHLDKKMYKLKISVKNNYSQIKIPKYIHEDAMTFVTSIEHFGRGYGKIEIENNILHLYTDSDGLYNILIIN